MILYAESSAVLAWLLGEPTSDPIRSELASAERVVTSSLTIVECTRGIARARADERLSARDELAVLRLLDVAAASWDVHALTDRVMAKARNRFPVEPIRTLDALHIATADLLREALPGLTILSLDDRIRANAAALGVVVKP